MSLATAPAIHYYQDHIRSENAVSKSANYIAKLVREVKDHNDESITLGWRTELRALLNSISSECGKENWDGEGAASINENIETQSNWFLELLPDNVIAPSISPDPCGGISFDWVKNRNIAFSVSVLGDSLVYAGLFGKEKTHGEVSLIDEIPQAISEILERYFFKS